MFSLWVLGCVLSPSSLWDPSPPRFGLHLETEAGSAGTLTTSEISKSVCCNTTQMASPHCPFVPVLQTTQTNGVSTLRSMKVGPKPVSPTGSGLHRSVFSQKCRECGTEHNDSQCYTWECRSESGCLRVGLGRPCPGLSMWVAVAFHAWLEEL